MENLGPIVVETWRDVVRDEFAKGREFGRIKDNIDILQWEMYSRSPSVQDSYWEDIRQAAEQLELIPEPTCILGLLAYEAGKFVGD